MFAKINIDPDGMEASLSFAFDDGITLTLDAIKIALNDAGVCFGINEDTINQAILDAESLDDSDLDKTDLASKKANLKQTSYIVAMAKKPVAGKPGTIDYKVDTNRHYKVDIKSDKVDYREQMQVESVKNGQVLAEIILPTEGIDGMSIMGQALPARDGKPAQIKCGKNVELMGDNIVATSDGIVSKLGDIISVSPVYEVSGALDMKVGNIDFNGAVVINGDVGDEFSIKAGGDIHIAGVVGKSNIISQGNVVINGGFNGKEKGVIIANGDVDIKYVNHGNIRSKGNVVVKKEINNSNVFCLGEIEISRGSILGGTVMALQGVKVAHLGSEMGVKTTVIVGTHYELFALEEKLMGLNQIFAEIEKKIDPYVGNSSKFKALPDNKKMEIKKLRELCLETRIKFLDIEAKMLPLIEDAKHGTAEAIIEKTIYPDVTLRSKHCFRLFNEILLGPLKAVEDIENSTMHIGQVN